jgi:hypothetical protein
MPTLFDRGWFRQAPAWGSSFIYRWNPTSSAGTDGAGGGYCVGIESLSRGAVIASDVVGSYDQLLLNTSDNWGTYLRKNVAINPPVVRETTNYAITANIISNALMLSTTWRTGLTPSHLFQR